MISKGKIWPRVMFPAFAQIGHQEVFDLLKMNTILQKAFSKYYEKNKTFEAVASNFETRPKLTGI